MLYQKVLENRDIQKRLDKIKPTVPSILFDQLGSLRWKLVQANVKAVLLQRNLLYFHQAIKKRDMTPYSKASDESLQLEKRKLSLTSIQLHLPHLGKQSLKPRRIISYDNNRTVTVAYGVHINDASKSVNLLKLLKSLVRFLSEEDRNEVLFVVYINILHEIDLIISSISNDFANEIEAGLLHIIVPPSNYYPDYSNFSGQFGDTKEKAIFDSKENLDMAYLMMYVRIRAAFYVQLSTDLLAVPRYATKIKNFAIKKASSNQRWFILSFSTDNCSGKLYRSEDLDNLVLFLLMYHAMKPCDWIVLGLVGTKFCNLDKGNCDHTVKTLTKNYRPVLFKKIKQ